MNEQDRWSFLQSLGKKHSLDLLGVVEGRWGELAPHMEERYKKWLDEGRHGSMDFMLKHQDLKYRPESLLPEVKSIVVCALNYYQEAPWAGGTLLGNQDASSQGRIARYAWGRDYHKTLKKTLHAFSRDLESAFPEEKSRVFVDSGPLHERLAAHGSEIAFTGKNTLMIQHEIGSYFFLGIILTTLEIPGAKKVKDPEANSAHPQGRCPSGCTRCSQVCPTGALEGAFRINASLCISYLTIEHKGSIPLELRPLMGDWIFGCDLCQEVCPFNLKAKQTGVEDFLTLRAGSLVDLEEILGIRNREEFIQKFAGSPLMRAGRDSLVRNACIAAANRKEIPLLEILQHLASHDSSSVVREHALWAVNCLKFEKK